MKKTRAPALTHERIQVVIDTLDAWKGKLTWDLLIAAVAKTTAMTATPAIPGPAKASVAR